MKELPKEFNANNDKCGEHKFIQVKREGNFALYRRERLNGDLFGFEVFRVKVVPAGAKLPGGGTVTEAYEQYPGAAAFGKSAFFLSGENAADRAHICLGHLLKGDKGNNVEEEETAEETTTVNVIKVSNTPIKEGLKWPDGEFSQKELAAFNKIANYKEVYTDLQKALARQILIRSSKRASSRGKSTQLFRVAQKAA